MIVKLSSSGRAVQVVDDDGRVFQTSVEFVRGLLEGRSPRGFVLLTRLPFMVSKDRYKPSPVWSGGEKVYEGADDTASGDVQSVRVQDKVKSKRKYDDKVVF